MKAKLTIIVMFIAFCGTGRASAPIAPENLAPPIISGIWLRPAEGVNAQPMWGFADGIRIGIAPLGGPRGLIRIYTPYLGHDDMVVTNFIALEPIPRGSDRRGLSELEWSGLDNMPGKRFVSGNTPEAPAVYDEYHLARGIVSVEDGVERLTVYIFCEKFDNGADVYVRVRFTAGKPYEFEISGYSTGSSVDLDRFVLTATMGNKGRLRLLHLAENAQMSSSAIWPDYRDIHFTPHHFVPLTEMITDANGGAWFVASNDEADPSAAEYVPGTHEHWKYKGMKATQYWYCSAPSPELKGGVNGRYTYWASESPIPGGISFENFEIMEPFVEGQTYTFGITPLTPEELILSIGK